MRTSVFFFIVGFSILTYSCSKSQCYYKTSNDEVLLENEWVPDFIKNIECFEINFQYDLDTNEVWGNFLVNDITKLKEIDIGKEPYFASRKLKRLKEIGMPNFGLHKISYGNLKSDFIIYLDIDSNEVFFYGRYK